MKRLRRFFVVLFAVSAIIGPSASALDQGVGDTYFNHIINGNYDIIPTNQDGSNSYKNSVMPNLDLTTTLTMRWSVPGGVDTGSGAVGTTALGIPKGQSFSYYSDPAYNLARKQAFFDFLKNKYNSGSAWEKMGSALIVNQMLGKAWGVGSRNITAAQFDDLYNRLVENDDVSMDRMYINHNDNTAGVRLETSPGSGVYKGQYDAVRWQYDDNAQMDAWVFSIGGKRLYQLQIICANPIGSLSGLPPGPVKKDQFDLTPTASTDKSVVEPGGAVTVTNTVKNDGTDPSASTIWRLTEMIFKPGVSLTTDDTKGRSNELQPCATGTDAFPNNGRTTCQTSPGEDKTNIIFNPGSPSASSYTYNVPSDTPVGTRICFTVSVSRPTQAASPSWRHSELKCIIVAKKPKVQIWGGDVRVGGTINTSTNTLDGKTYGSWGEYGALSNGQNSGFASGSGLNGGNANSTQPGWSSLTFANTDTCTFGCYNFTLSSRSLADQFGTGNTPPANGDLNTWDNGTYTVGDITLGSTSLNPGKSIVIISSGTVTIADDIKYNEGTYNSIKDIPQLVIRAPNINIQGNVKRVDAWLIAVSTTGGSLNTCTDTIAPSDDRLTAGVCSNPLVINGPVVADKIYLRRTSGSESAEGSRGNPAETFNLRADAYLWGSNYANGKGKVRTVYTKELPPRF